MLNMQFWKITEKTPDTLRRSMAESLRNLYAMRPDGYVLPRKYEIEKFDDLESIYFAMGKSVSGIPHIIGYSKCVEEGPSEHLDGSSTFKRLFGSGEDVIGPSGKKIDFGSVGSCMGFSEYTGRGKALGIVTFYVFIPTGGYDSELVKHIKREDYELFVCAASENNTRNCLGENGFIETDMAAHNGDWPIMTWHNPNYE